MNIICRYAFLLLLIVGTTLLVTPPAANGQKKQVSAEQRITELEQLVQDLQQRIVQLEAKFNTPPVTERQNVGNGNWRDKSNWR